MLQAENSWFREFCWSNWQILTLNSNYWCWYWKNRKQQLSQHFAFPFRLKPTFPPSQFSPSSVLPNHSERRWVAQELQISANFFCTLLLVVFLPLLLGSYCSSVLVQDSPSLQEGSCPSVSVSSCNPSTIPFHTTLPLCLPFLLIGLFTFLFLCPLPPSTKPCCCCSMISAVRLNPINSSTCYIF